MNELILNNNEPTMSSLEIVDLINQERKAEAERNPGTKYIELRHDHFMAKVPKVLGANNAPKFTGTQKYGNNNTRAIYNLPQREAFLMVLSESTQIQAKLYDAYQALQKKVAISEAKLSEILTGMQSQIASNQKDNAEIRKMISETNSNLVALLNNLAIKNEPKIETKAYFQPSENKAERSDINLYHRITFYGKKFRPDLDQEDIRERAKEIGMMASRLSKERRIRIHEEENLDSRYQGKIRYYHQDILNEVFRLIF